MNKYFTIHITETLEKQVNIEAETESEALSKVHELYRKCDIILSADDYTKTEMNVKRP